MRRRRPITKHLLPYRRSSAATSSSSAIPVDIRQTFVKRVIGVPGDRIRLVEQAAHPQRQKLNEPYVYHKTEYIDSYRDNFPSEPNVHVADAPWKC